MILLVVAFLLSGGLRLPRPRRRKKEVPVDVDAVARLMLIGMTAGLPLVPAIGVAADELGSSDLRQIIRASKIHGVAAAFASAEGPPAALLHRLARAHTTGASGAGSVATFISDRRVALKSETLERLRRLPVKLTVPLTLLILPGFIILTLGPTVASIIRQLLGGLM